MSRTASDANTLVAEVEGALGLGSVKIQSQQATG